MAETVIAHKPIVSGAQPGFWPDREHAASAACMIARTVEVVSSAQMIDWDTAISTGVRFARQGPQVSLADARAVVAELRGLTAVVQQPVRELTGLTSQGDTGPVAVVDRPGWIKANVGGFRVVLEPLAERLAERSNSAPAAGSVIGTIGSRATGMQGGLILA